MEIITFIVNHITDVLLVIAAVIAFVVIVKAGQTKILRQILFNLVTEAEKLYGSGTGELKYSAVAEWIYSYIPDWLKSFFTEADISKMIEEVLDQAKKAWAENAEIGEYTETPPAEPVKIEELKAVIEDVVSSQK